jgi:hypothetical protein
MADPKDPPPLNEQALAAELKARLRNAGVREAEPPSMTRIRPAPALPLGAPPPVAAATATRSSAAPPAPRPAPAPQPAPVVRSSLPAAPPEPAAPADFAPPADAPPLPLPLPKLSGELAPQSRHWRAGPLAIVVFFLTIAILLVAMLIYKAFAS